MIRKKLSPIRKVQKKLLEASKAASEAAGNQLSRAAHAAKEQVKELDSDLGISDSARARGAKISKSIKELDRQHQASERIATMKATLSDIEKTSGESINNAVQETGIRGVTDEITAATNQLIVEHGLDTRLGDASRFCEDLYGSARHAIKPYFVPDTPHELLESVQKELTYISACIMQVSPGEAEKLATQFGAVVASKIVGIGATAGLLSLVSAFGTAGTGTAIASLSGAASTSATLSWVGGLLGGGMATGAVLTGGVTIIVGLGAYKSLSSQQREFENLAEVEQRIVQYCWILIAMIDEQLRQPNRTFSVSQTNQLLQNTLLPLQGLLEENVDLVCGNLDRVNAAAYRQHVLRDFKPGIIVPLETFVAEELTNRAKQIDLTIGGVILSLLAGSMSDSSDESQLVLTALRRSDPDLAQASEGELRDYLANYEADQLKGIVNNVKGIYHELLWVEQYNANHDDSRAELYEVTNNPGADVRIVDLKSGDIVGEYQLKATSKTGYVAEHEYRYSDIEVIATEEVARKMDGVDSSGYFNEEITETTEQAIEGLANNTLQDKALNAAELAATMATSQELIQMLQGEKDLPEAVSAILKKTSTATATAAVTAYLFG